MSDSDHSVAIRAGNWLNAAFPPRLLPETVRKSIKSAYNIEVLPNVAAIKHKDEKTRLANSDDIRIDVDSLFI